MAANDEVFREIEELMSELSVVDSNARQLEVKKDKAVKAIVDKYSPQIDPLVSRRDEIMQKLSEMYVEHEDLLTGGHSKTAVFRSGTLSAHMSAGSLVIEKGEEDNAIAFIRKHHKLRRFTRQGKITINKTELKKDPKFAAKVPGVSIEQAENLTVRLARTKIDLTENLNPYRKRIN